MEINKLIDALRVCADENIICPACERYMSMKVTGGTADCVDDLLVKAASALEAQQERIAELESERRWIPMGGEIAGGLRSRHGMRDCSIPKHKAGTGYFAGAVRRG